ncbi:uncharacterized protein Z518_01545 [Rhinocladiella mackenziei CBS 650.93]|uniref:Nucleoside phosphorylase domain-containing protein n=1 Tax=Rhinocladiella mackenziei CBS 650.93 TaxID=1442369 RepID=A0A0D2G689_9EURO|nr:uncharacterized protein Z518_01545 [Rhinocladiella mackenziei CBS 650.93]KIX10462.1 hypothetical protein Z518_01545 [Rhinocladiella mackenziei CBS 650.93]
MAGVSAPLDRQGFETALICALPLEASCVQAVFDEFWKDYGKAPGDPNTYTTGAIGKRHVVLAYMPNMGTTSAAAVAVGLRLSFPKIKLALVVGICGGVPHGTDGEEIVLGDVIISQGLIQYDFGGQYPEAFKRKNTIRDSLGRPPPEIRAIQAKLETYHYVQKMQSNIAMFLDEILPKLPNTKHPGRENDVLYRPSYVHKHRAPVACDECREGDRICDVALKMECEDLGCGTVMRVTRKRLMDTPTGGPRIHFGIMGSANTVVKSGAHRDQIAKADGIIAFEMEGAGVWDYFPSIVIKGVCDYADSHKRKGWQRYAAATAAACMKAFLGEWSSNDAPTGSVDVARARTYFLAPRRRVKDFFGRGEELDKISSYFNDEVERPRILVLHALGGQGKSQIALEYCQKLRKTYQGVFWINSSTKSTTVQSFATIAHELDSSMAEVSNDDDAKVKFVLRMLEQWEDRWLVVFDNYDDPASFSDVEQFIPQEALTFQGRKGDILFTSRHRGLEELGTILDIPPMQEDAGVALLLHRYSSINVDDYMSEGSKIVDRLGGLALAIDQASAYMKHKRLPIDKLGDFLSQYEAQRKKVLQHTADHFWKYTRISDQNERETAINAFTTWEMTFQQLQNGRDSGGAVTHFLTLTAFLAPIRVSESLFKHHWESSKPPPDWLKIFVTSSDVDEEGPSSNAEEDANGQEHLTPEATDNAGTESSNETWDTELFWDHICLAYQMSLLQSISPAEGPEGAAFLLHPLIRDWLQLREHSKERQVYTHEAIDLIVSSIQTYNTRDSDVMIKQSILLHMDALLLAVKEYLKDGHRLGQDIKSCGNAGWFASFYRDHGRFDTSLYLFRTEMETRVRVLGKEHPDTLMSVNNLALVLSHQGKYPEAEQMHREALQVTERVLGYERPSTLRSMNNLAGVLSHQGKYPEAEQMHREVLQVTERVLGKKHPDTLTSKYPEAEQMHREVLQVRKRVLGKEHPGTLTSMNNLAGVLSHQGKYPEAEQMHRETLQVTERVLSKKHPDTLTSMNNLAFVLSHQGKYPEAESLQVQVFKASLEILRPQHPHVTIYCRGLLSIWESQGREDTEIETMLRDILGNHD